MSGWGYTSTDKPSVPGKEKTAIRQEAVPPGLERAAGWKEWGRAVSQLLCFRNEKWAYGGSGFVLGFIRLSLAPCRPSTDRILLPQPPKN